MREFLEFAFVQDEEAYPVYVADTPLVDLFGNSEGFQVCHRDSLILISPCLAPQFRGDAIRSATIIARQTFPLRALNLPFAGDVS